MQPSGRQLGNQRLDTAFSHLGDVGVAACPTDNGSSVKWTQAKARNGRRGTPVSEPSLDYFVRAQQQRLRDRETIISLRNNSPTILRLTKVNDVPIGRRTDRASRSRL